MPLAAWANEWWIHGYIERIRIYLNYVILDRRYAYLGYYYWIGPEWLWPPQWLYFASPTYAVLILHPILDSAWLEYSSIHSGGYRLIASFALNSRTPTKFTLRDMLEFEPDYDRLTEHLTPYSYSFSYLGISEYVDLYNMKRGLALPRLLPTLTL